MISCCMSAGGGGGGAVRGAGGAGGGRGAARRGAAARRAAAAQQVGAVAAGAGWLGVRARRCVRTGSESTRACCHGRRGQPLMGGAALLLPPLWPLLLRPLPLLQVLAAPRRGAAALLPAERVGRAGPAGLHARAGALHCCSPGRCWACAYRGNGGLGGTHVLRPVGLHCCSLGAAAEGPSCAASPRRPAA